MSEYYWNKVFYMTGIKDIHQALLFKSEKISKSKTTQSILFWLAITSFTSVGQ